MCLKKHLAALQQKHAALVSAALQSKASLVPSPLEKFPLVPFQSKAAFERESDVPLKNEEFEVTKTAGT